MSTETTTETELELSLIRCAAGTDVGMRRAENQDSFCIVKRPEFHAYFVADGMGGAHGGATASRMATSLLQEALGASDVRITPAFINRTVQEINRQIFKKGCSEPAYAGMGTTLVGLIFTRQGVLRVNVGDSRAYKTRGDSIEQISEDHTLVRELVQAGAISADEAQSHPVSHMLTRSLGPIDTVEIDCRMLSAPAQVGDIYILCTDGLYNNVTADDILGIVRQNPLDDANQILINLANQRGGSDNITALVIAIEERTPRTRKTSIPFAVVDDDGTEESEQSAPDQNVETPPPPPPVAEPLDRAARRRALRKQSRLSAGHPRALPTLLLLSTTLLIGLVLGNLARKVSLKRSEILAPLAFFMQDSPNEAEQPSELPQEEEGNPLANLARQIRDERRTASEQINANAPRQPRQPEQIKRSIEGLKKQIQQLSSASPSVSQDEVTASRDKLDLIQRSYASVEAELDVASRAVTLWLSRQVAFEGQGSPSSSITELEQVAAYSEAIKEKLSSLATLSYRLREKADEVELHPADGALRGQLEEIEDKRDQLSRELQIDVRRSINSILTRSYKEYESVKNRRDKLWTELQAAKRDLEIQTALAESDPAKRIAFREILEQRLASEEAGLRELQRS
jgi:protein phosphatase